MERHKQYRTIAKLYRDLKYTFKHPEKLPQTLYQKAFLCPSQLSKTSSSHSLFHFINLFPNSKSEGFRLSWVNGVDCLSNSLIICFIMFVKVATASHKLFTVSNSCLTACSLTPLSKPLLPSTTLADCGPLIPHLPSSLQEVQQKLRTSIFDESLQTSKLVARLDWTL